MEDHVGEHPFFAGQPPSWTQGPAGPQGANSGPFGPFGPGPHGHGRRHRHGRFDIPHRSRGEAQETNQTEEVNEKTADEDREMGDDATPDPPEETPGNPPNEEHQCRGRRGGGRRGGWGGRGHHGHRSWGHPYAFTPFHHMMGGPGSRGFGFLSDLFGQQPENEEAPSDDWKPEADVFDTESAFVVHISLPGANKEDIGVSWEPEKSELTVSGVVHRPGDEAFLKTLSLDERKVGAFERKVRLGTRSSPAQVDIEGITAKLDNGILYVEVPKLNADFVEIKKVDIE